MIRRANVFAPNLFYYEFAGIGLGWGFPGVRHDHRNNESKAIALFGIPGFVGNHRKIDPRALILSHLPPDSGNAILGSSGLGLQRRKLLSPTYTRTDGIFIRGSELGRQDSGLPAHLFKLSVEDPQGSDSNDNKDPGKDYHRPVSIKEGLFASIWLSMALGINIVAMWLIQMRSRRARSGREMWTCLGFGLALILISAPLVFHGMDRLLS
jgi:hypothetical protein